MLDRDRHVREHRRALRPGDSEQVGVVRAHEAEVCARPLRPLVAQQLPTPTVYVDLLERAGHGVEAGGEHKDVELVLAVLGTHPGRGDLLNRRLLDVDELDVVAVEHFVVAGLQRHPLGAERVVAGGELLGGHGVVDPLPDLLAHPLGDGVVGFPGVEDVVVVAYPQPKPPRPHRSWNARSRSSGVASRRDFPMKS